MDHDTPLTKLEEQLKTQVQRSISLYLTNLQFLIDACRYSLVDKAKRLNKYIQTEEDNLASTTIAATNKAMLPMIIQRRLRREPSTTTRSSEEWIVVSRFIIPARPRCG